MARPQTSRLPVASEPEDAADEVERHRMPLIEHLRELRTRVIYAAIAVGIGMVVSLVMVDTMYAVLTAPLRLVIPEAGGVHPDIDGLYRSVLGETMTAWASKVQVKGTLAITSSPLEGIYTYFRVALWGGVGMSIPVVSWQVWQFIAPGLYNTERRLVYPLVFFSSLLFLAGGSFAFFVILPLALPFFLTVLDAEALLSVEGYLGTVVRMTIVFGACFQLPVVTWFLAKLGLIDHIDMIKGFRYSIVGIFLVAAIVTPPEVLTQVVLAVPLILLYGVGIVVAWFSSTKVREPEDEDENTALDFG